jgi:hypothetical protein
MWTTPGEGQLKSTIPPSSIASDGTSLTFSIPSTFLAMAGAGTYSVQAVGQGIASNEETLIVTSAPAASAAPTLTSVSPSQATGDTVVTLYGTNLEEANTVNFYQGSKWTGGVPEQDLTVASNGDSISFSVSRPFAANWPGMSQVEVITPNGTSNMLPITILAPASSGDTQTGSTGQSPTNTAPSETNGGASYQALQQQLVQLMTLLIQLLQEAAAKGIALPAGSL